MTNPTTEPGLGGPGPAASGTDTLPDASPSPPASSFDDAMRDAELRVAEARNREIVDREAERRRIHLETTAKLRDVEKGSDAHFELLALRQKWTLPLDDDDYVLWMQHHLLEQHGQAMADEANQKRRDRAKQMAKGPAIVIAIVAGLSVVAGIGWFLRGTAEKRANATAAPVETAQPTPQAAAPAPAEGPTVAPAGEAKTPAASADPAGAASAVSPPVASTPNASAPPNATPPSAGAGSTGAPKGAPPKPGAPKKDMWEREF